MLHSLRVDVFLRYFAICTFCFKVNQRCLSTDYSSDDLGGQRWHFQELRYMRDALTGLYSTLVVSPEQAGNENEQKRTETQTETQTAVQKKTGTGGPTPSYRTSTSGSRRSIALTE